MSKYMAGAVLLAAFVELLDARPLLAQACLTTPVPTASGPALACASPGAACNGGAGKCISQSVKTGPNSSLCRCAEQGKFSTAAAAVNVQELVGALSTANRGDVFTFQFGPNDLREQQNLLFVPNLFDVEPDVLSIGMNIEVIGFGKKRQEEDGASPSLTPDTVELSITGTTVLDSFQVDQIGQTGLNTETFIAGTILFPLKKLVFEGLVTATLTNNIWTARDPIVLVEGFGGNLDSQTNTFAFSTGAPDASFILPIIEKRRSGR
jgi:hypothetical protein